MGNIGERDDRTKMERYFRERKSERQEVDSDIQCLVFSPLGGCSVQAAAQ